MAEGKGGVAMYIRLQIAYALEFAIWGCWSYMLGGYGAQHGIQTGSLYAAFALGALFAPLVGPIADKKFAAQKVLAFMQFICAAALAGCFTIAKNVAASGSSDPGVAWWILMFVAGLMFMPSIPLLNAIVFKHIPNDKKSPFVFIFGTLGWIAVNLILGAMGEKGVEQFYLVDVICALALAAYSLTLPNTPPAGSSKGDPFGFRALKLFGRWDFAIFMICATLVGIFGSNYYFALFGQYFDNSKGVYNQYSEIIFMAALAFAVAKIGLKWTVTLGLAAWGVRYLLFAQVNDCCALVGVFMHGLAYAFLYTAAYMYGDKVAPKEMKASVQALIAFLLLGVAQTLSGYAADGFQQRYKTAVEENAPAATETEAKEDTVTFFSLTSVAYAQDEDIAVAEDAASADEIVIEEATVEEAVPAEEATAPAEDSVVEEDLVEEATAPAEDSVVEEAVPAEEATAPAEDSVVEEDLVEEDLVEEDLVEEAPVADAEAPAEQAPAEAADAKDAREKTPWYKIIDESKKGNYNWQKIWGVPGLFCIIFAVIFALLGREPKSADDET